MPSRWSSARLSEIGDDDVPVQGDVGELILGLDVPLHQRNERHLHVDHQQGHAGVLEILREAGVIDVIVRRQRVADFLERDVGATEFARIVPIVPGQPRSTRTRDRPALITQ